jgi:hypothetical protein
VAMAAIIQIVSCGVMPAICSASMDQAADRKLVSYVLDGATQRTFVLALLEPSRDLRVRSGESSTWPAVAT